MRLDLELVDVLLVRRLDRAPVHALVADVLPAVWALVSPKADAAGTVNGGTCVPVMMKSKLPQADLAKIWGMVDSGGKGRINQAQFGQALGLISQMQRGEAVDLSVVDATTPAPEHMV